MLPQGPIPIIETTAPAAEPQVSDIVITPDAPPAAPDRPSRRISPMMAGGMTAFGIIALSLAIGHQLSSRIEASRAKQASAAAVNAARATAAAARMNSQGPSKPEPRATSDASPAYIPAPSLASNAGEITDTIQTAAMAPIRPESKPVSKNPPRAAARNHLRLYLQAREGVSQVAMHDGPGTQHALVGFVDLDESYRVLEWKDRWFHISLDEKDRKTAWVHYDGIELISEEEKP